ncbi:DUF2612 domain-containing protein [Ralstonia solanacearum]|uniref:DUF2612 domain-containing protein n=1 Tax=Ralstonia solanacearum TaxID=305 RepID=UPI001E323CFA|nr:DUF2612 domain-containing protein [Ralstonia solanacearum]
MQTIFAGCWSASRHGTNATHTAFWENWIRDVFDLRTANDFGLSVWSEILGVPLAVTVDPTKPGTPVFGFAARPTGISGIAASAASHQRPSP